MDYVTRQFINLTKKLRDDLRRFLATLHSDLQKQTKSIDKASESYRQQQHKEPYSVIAEVRAPPDVSRKRESQENRSHRVQVFIAIGTCGAFIAGSWYGAVAWRQLNEMIAATGAAQQAIQESRLNRRQAEKSLTASVEQFHLDQRAWVYADFNLTYEPQNGRDAPTINIGISNTGKTPAVELDVFYRTFIGSAPPSMTDFSKIKPVSEGLLPPSTDRGLVGTDRINDVLGQLSAYASKQVSIYIVGKIDYCDVYRNHHWTTFCASDQYGTASNIFSFCKANNDVGDYAEPCHGKQN